MRIRWITLAQLAVLAGCSGSHMREDDGGVDAEGLRDGDFYFDADDWHDAGPWDAGPDAGPQSACDADDARAVICPDAACDGPPSWHWNGDDCFWIECGTCEGTDCAAGYGSESQCLAAHASCEPTQCRATGGTWMWWTEECEHYHCGQPVPATCIVGRAVCDCGPFRNFVPGVGCADDPTCPIPEPASRDALCTGTGGSWSPICCDTECGDYCPLACTAMACDCGPGRVFDEGRGCIESARCHERLAGETCEGEARCAEGTICCQQCGGAGCFGAPTCDAPQCDDNPDFDECGNCLLCP